MKRREFISLVGRRRGCLAAGSTCPAEAEARSHRRVEPRVHRYPRGRLAYTKGCGISVTPRDRTWRSSAATGTGIQTGFQQLAADLVRLKVDVIVVISTSPARAAKDATGVIPIVVGGMADPVGDELIVSLARPGGNISGTTFLGPELIAKRFGLLKDAIPRLSRVAALWQPNAYGKRTMEGMLRETETAARGLGTTASSGSGGRPGRYRSGGLSTMRREHADAVIALPSPMLYGEHKRIVELAATEPASGNVRRAGGCGRRRADVLRGKLAKSVSRRRHLCR